MARQRLAIGTSGDITVTGYIDKSRKERLPHESRRAGHWVARTYYRDKAGVRRQVEAGGTTKAKAETALKVKLLDFKTATQGAALRSGMSMADAAEVWLAWTEGQTLAPASRALYRGNVERYVKGSTIAGLTLVEANRVPVLRTWLQDIANAHGDGAAKGARSVVSGILNLAVGDEVLPFSAMPAVKTPRATTRKAPRVSRDGAEREARQTERQITDEELSRLLSHADSDPFARAHDLADLFAYLAETGVRISEALGQRWGDIDLEARTLRVHGTKTRASVRDIHLTTALVSRLRERAAQLYGDGVKPPADHVVFAAPTGRGPWVTPSPTTPRNRDTVLKHVRVVLDAAGLEWATSHSFRHMVITKIGDAVGIGTAGDWAGHANVSTTLGYITRKRDTAPALRALEAVS